MTFTPNLIDSHCHLTYPPLLDQIGGVLARARAVGIVSIITIATDLADADRALALAAGQPDVFVVAGIHPHQAGAAPADWDGGLSNLVRRDDVFAVGETGLDYHYDFSSRASQAAVFRRQLALASEVQKPVVIHCREAHEDTLAELARFPGIPRVVFHCFTGTIAEAREILDRGYWISLTGVVTFKRSDELRQVAALIPDDRLMIETDAPYLSPEPVRNVRPNEPANLVHTAACVARARGLGDQDLAGLTTRNARTFFQLPEPR